jgi:hypothetical protein
MAQPNRTLRKRRSLKPGLATPTAGLPKVWLYVVDGRNSTDLSILDATGVDHWRANPNTRRGDLILMYRSAPYSDIAYVFVAADDPRRTTRTRKWEWDWQVKITGGFRLPRAITLDEIRGNRALSHWSFVRHQQGIMNRRKDLGEEGVWPELREMLEDRGADLPTQFGPTWKTGGRPRKVFLSYVREDGKRVDNLRSALSANRIDTFFDLTTIRPGQNYESEIKNAIRNSKAFVVCLSPAWLRNRGYARKELKWALALVRRRKNFLFPAKIAACRQPHALTDAKLHFVDLFGLSRKANLNTLVYRLTRVLKG